MRTGRDQVAPASVVRANSTEFAANGKAGMKLAQAMYACRARVGLPVIASVSLPWRGEATVAGSGQLRPPSREWLATTAVVGGSVERSAAKPPK